MSNIVSRTLSVHKEHEMLLKLEAAGLTDYLAQRVIGSKGNDLAMRIVRVVQNGDFEATTSQMRAREIMGRNMFSIGEAIKCFRIKPSKKQLDALATVPFTETTLEECRGTHILVAVFPLPIRKIRSRSGSRLFYEPAWHSSLRQFMRSKGDVSWHLIRKTPVENSIGKTWEDQQALLSDKELVPAVRVMVYTIIGYYLATGEPLFQEHYVRCCEMLWAWWELGRSSDFAHVSVGRFSNYGLSAECTTYASLSGLASSRKPG